MFKKILCVIISSILLTSTVYAGDNLDGDGGGDGKATRGFYEYKKYMYKVSLYVGKQDTVTTEHSIDNFYKIGNPVFVKGDWAMPTDSSVYATNKNKIDYIEGERTIVPEKITNIIKDSPPQTSIEYSNTDAIKDYFGDILTFKAILDEIVKSENTTRENLLLSLQFKTGEKEKVWGTLKLEEIIPIEKDEDDDYTNKVP